MTRNKHKVFLLILLAALASMLSLACGSGGTQTGDHSAFTVETVYPPDTEVSIETVAVDGGALVRLNAPDGVDGIYVNLSYDRSVLHPVEIQDGSGWSGSTLGLGLVQTDSALPVALAGLNGATVSGEAAIVRFEFGADKTTAATFTYEDVVDEFGYSGDAMSRHLTWTARLPGDSNGDWSTNGLDLFPVATGFGFSEGESGYIACADLNADGVVNGQDVFSIAANYTRTLKGFNVYGSSDAQGPYNDKMNSSMVQAQQSPLADCTYQHEQSASLDEDYYTLTGVLTDEGEETDVIAFCYGGGGGGGRDFITIEGEIQSLGDMTVTVHSITFIVNDETVIFGPWGLPMDFDDLEVGEYVSIFGWIDDEDTVYAIHIQVGYPQEPVIWLGELVAISNESFDLVGIYEDWAFTFDTFDENMQVFDIDGTEIEYGDLVVGDILEVWTYVDGEDDVVLTIFKTQRPPNPGDFVDICAQILDLGEHTVTVGYGEGDRLEYLFVVTSDTMITDEWGDILDFSDLEIGMHVCVFGHYEEGDGVRVLYADIIDVMRNEPPPPHREWMVHGDITAIDDTLMSVTVGGDDPDRTSLTFFVNDATVIVDCFGNVIGFEDLAVGDTIKAWGSKDQEDDAYIASNVQLDCGGDNFQGIVFEIGEDYFVVGSDENSDDWMTYYVTNSTRFYDMMTGEEVEFEFLEVGHMVWGWYIMDEEDGARYAVEVFIHDHEPPPSRHWHVHGEITELDNAGSVTLTLDNGNEFQFNVTEGAVYLDCWKDPIEFSDLAVGDTIWASGWYNADDVAEAHNVMIDCGQTDFWGEITELGEDWFKVGGDHPGMPALTLTVDAHTEFFNMFEQPIDFSDLEVGMFASGFYVPGEDGELIAGDVYVEDNSFPPPPDDITVMGIIDELGEYELTVTGYNGDSWHFIVDDDTEIIDGFGNPIEFEDLSVGDEVLISATDIEDSDSWLALFIMLAPRDPMG